MIVGKVSSSGGDTTIWNMKYDNAIQRPKSVDDGLCMLVESDAGYSGIC